MPAPSRRRWFRFSLRALLIAMVVFSALGGYVAHERRIVQARKAVFREAASFPHSNMAWHDVPLEGSKFLVRRYFGDRRFLWILAMDPVPESVIARLRSVYPEAEIYTEWETLAEHHEPIPKPQPGDTGPWAATWLDEE